MAQNKKQETIDPAHLKPEDKLKFEIAEELGLLDKCWSRLEISDFEGKGRIGGMVQKERSGKDYLMVSLQNPVVFGTIVQPENVMGDLLWKKDKYTGSGSGLCYGQRCYDTGYTVS